MFRNPGSAHGGITPVINNLAEEFVHRGFSIHLLTFTHSDAGHECGPFEMISVGKGTKVINVIRLWHYLRRQQPDVLLTAGQRANLVASWAKILPGIKTPVWGSLHNTESKVQSGKNWIRQLRKRYVMRFSYKLLDGIIAVSDGVADDFATYVNIPRELIKVVYNPLIGEYIHKKAKEFPNHPWFASEKKLPIVLGIGRLTEQKDFPTLIKAFALVHRKVPCRLIILGEGKKRKELEDLVSSMGMTDCVDLPGFVENPFSYMSRASLFVLSSAWEGFGNVLVESLALALPVVSTDCPHGPREILEDGKYGSLVPPGNAPALAKAILHTLENPPQKEFLMKAVERFRIETCAENYLQLFGLNMEIKDTHISTYHARYLI